MLRFLPIFVSGILLGLVLFPITQDWLGSPESPGRLETSDSASASTPPDRWLGRNVEDSRRNAIVRAIQSISPSVVSVTTTMLKEYEVQYPHPFWDFFGYPKFFQEKIPSIGSGFVIREDGYVLTNSHVVEDAREVAITFPDGQRYNVRDIRNDVLIDPQTDLAVIRIDAEDLPAADLGDSDSIIIGEWAIAIGNPFGLMIEDPNPTVTVGVISALDRNFHPDDGRLYQNMIQTDASINPGNSGGPLVNGAGEVIGVNSFIFSRSGASHGIGFAIPINKAAEVARQLIEKGSSQEFWTGIHIHNLNARIARTLGLATASGALIVQVDDRSPGVRAGLQPADVIVAINNLRVQNAEDVLRVFRQGRVGDVFNLKVFRGRVLLETRLVLEQAPLNQ